ncbi:MAG: hypothetical protein JWN32_4511, partial [Solirubrobacterales bacterium]|nr:hypothetical protein [Solirubrobacterales bacterium]
NAAADLRRCVDALTRNTTWPAELVLIDDASTDPGVFDVLADLAGRPAVRILRNSTNLGFTATVNRGLRATTGDVVVLNSDTEVGPRWLERLRAATYRDPRIGSATAGSDNAGAFSLPVIGERNAVPLHLSVDDAARLVAQAVGDRPAPTPTANGFCMYLRRAMLDDVGLLDEAAFPRGYGEENDLSLRASRRGWTHVVDPGIYVHHAREASFGAEKAALGKAGRAVLNERYPEYTPAVREFVADPVMADARRRVAEAFAAATSPLPRALFVIHEGGGGTPVGNFELMHGLAGRYECLLLTCDRGRVRLDRIDDGERVPLGSWELHTPTRVLDFTRGDYRAIAERVLREHAIDLVHVRHLFKHTFDLPVVAARLGIPVVFSFHDFYFACPTVHLLDDTGTYCAARCTAGDGACHVPPAGLDGLPHLKHAFVHQWREEVTAMLAGVDAFVTTSEHVRAVHRDALPAIGERPFAVIPHGRTLTQAHGLNVAPKPGGVVRVLVLANMEAHKGGDYLREIKRHAGARLELHFLGDTPERYADLGVVHGRYRPEELHDRVAAITPALVGLFSIVAETFSHALTEAWALGVPVVATDLGAFGERLRAHEGGWLIPPDDSAEAARRILTIADDPTSYRVQAWKADLRGVPTVAEMTDTYATVYTETLARRRSLAAPDAPSPLRLTAIVGGEDGRYPGSTYVRIVRPLRHPSVTGEITTRIRYASDGPIPDDAQAVLIQRTAIPPENLLAFLDEIDARGLPLIVDLDDHLLLKAEDEHYGPHQTAIRALLETAAVVTVSTPALAEAVRGHTARVEIVPNAIDERLFLSGLTEPPAGVPPAPGEPIRLVYIGSTTHSQDLALLRPVMEELHQRAPGRFVLEVVGVQRPDEDDEDPWFDRLVIPDDTKPYPRFVPWLREHRHRWHVALAPLADTEFNHYKSDLKWLEYTALGLPVVASALEPYRSIEDGVTGRLVGTEPEAWAEAITAMIDDPDTARRLAGRAAGVLAQRTIGTQGLSAAGAIASLRRLQSGARL